MKLLSWDLGFLYYLHHLGFFTVYKSNQDENVFSHIFAKYGQNGCEDVLLCGGQAGQGSLSDKINAIKMINTIWKMN